MTINQKSRLVQWYPDPVQVNMYMLFIISGLDDTLSGKLSIAALYFKRAVYELVNQSDAAFITMMCGLADARVCSTIALYVCLYMTTEFTGIEYYKILLIDNTLKLELQIRRSIEQ